VSRNYHAEDMADLRLQFGGLCQGCGARHSMKKGKIGPLEFAHKRGVPQDNGGPGRGANRRFYEVRDHPERFYLLCWSCHCKYDRGFLLDKQMTPRPE
jgi:hypothetical protein